MKGEMHNNYSKEFYSYREELIKQYKNVSKDLYERLLEIYKYNGTIDISNDYNTIYKLYIQEKIDDRDIAKLCGLSVIGMGAKRRRMGIQDRPSEFDITLQMTQLAIERLGSRAYSTDYTK